VTPIGPIVGATTPLKLQDTLIGGSLSTWGAKEALKAISGQTFADYAAMERAGLDAVNAATRRGTIVHDHVAAILRGETPSPTPETAGYIYAYASFLADHRPEFIAVEQRVLNPSAMYAGTFDFLAKVNGRVALGDIKSGRFKQSHILQLAAYSMCRMAGTSLTLDQWHRYWWTGDTADLTPLPRIQDYYVLLLRSDGYELVPVQVNSADKRHYLGLVKTFHAMKAWDLAQAQEVAAA
jgi:hypothetical protein